MKRIRNMRELASYLACQEGKKHQATIGDIRELLGLLSDVTFASLMRHGKLRESVAYLLLMNGARRAKCRRGRE